MSIPTFWICCTWGNPREVCGQSGHGPIVVAGGPCAFTPEPLHAFMDAFMIGDGEEVIVEATRDLLESREAGPAPAGAAGVCAAIPGCTCPACTKRHTMRQYLKSLTPTVPEAPRVSKRVVKDLNAAYYPREIPVPYTQIVHDRIMLEIMRGCTRGCLLCQAGMLYPVRERSVEKHWRLAEGEFGGEHRLRRDFPFLFVQRGLFLSVGSFPKS